MNLTQCNFNYCVEFESWVSSWPDGIIALDDQQRIIYLNTTASELTGWQREQVEGKTIHESFCTQIRNDIHSLEHCLFSQAPSGHGEPVSDTWLMADGHYLSVDFRYFSINSSGATQFLVVFTSNTDRLHNQAEMEKFAEYADKNPMPIAEFDREGQMLYCNPAMQEEMLQHGFNDSGQAVFLPEQLQQICAQEYSEGATNVKTQVGERWFNWHFLPLESQIENQSEWSVLGYSADITREKQAELNLSAARAEARRNFYAKMVHELRTPLNAIVGFSDVLLWRSASKLEERDTRALRSIKLAGIQLNEMVSDTLDLSKIEAGKMHVEPEHFSIGDILKDIHEQMNYLAEAKRLNYENNCELSQQVFSDKRKVRQIMINLISNAIKYTKTGSVKVLITSTQASLGAEAGECFRLAVVDTGMGIPEEKLATLFQEYEQVRSTETREIQGTGVGLALVKELVSILQGRIEVESALGEGSTFTVELPICFDPGKN